MLIFFDDARLMHQFKKFKKTGAIPEAIYAGETISYNTDVVYWARVMLALEQRDSYNDLMSNLQTVNTPFKYPYILSKYKRTLNPTISLYEEYQKALFTISPTTFDQWVIDICNTNSSEIIKHIESDIESIMTFLNRYKKATERSLLIELVSKLNVCLTGFKLCHHSRQPS